MAKLYGLGNVIISEIVTRLMLNSDFNKLVYYKDVDEDGEDILSMPDLDDPVDELYKKQVWLHKRPDKPETPLHCIRNIQNRLGSFGGLCKSLLYIFL